MSPEQALAQQFLAFHGAVIDSCDRAAGPDRSDAMALKLRNNALALTRMQLTIMALTKAEAWQPVAEAAAPTTGIPQLAGRTQQDVDEVRQTTIEAVARFDEVTAEADGFGAAGEDVASVDPWRVDDDRLLAGDTLSRFVSRPLRADESAHDVWQQIQEADPRPRRRNAALPGAGFRSSSS